MSPPHLPSLSLSLHCDIDRMEMGSLYFWPCAEWLVSKFCSPILKQVFSEHCQPIWQVPSSNQGAWDGACRMERGWQNISRASCGRRRLRQKLELNSRWMQDWGLEQGKNRRMNGKRQAGYGRRIKTQESQRTTVIDDGPSIWRFSKRDFLILLCRLFNVWVL